MKTISDYTIYCTESQTKKALELGAPIKIIEKCGKLSNSIILDENEEYYKLAIVPTAEQMIGWLEEQESITSINVDYYATCNTWAYWISFKDDGVHIKQDFNSRQEATLAAIDTALEYLNNKNNCNE